METVEVGVIKPEIRDFQSLNFNDLGPGQFEKLLYCMYRRKIDNGEYTGLFDDISSMSGGSERGRDSVLFYDGKQVGLIQCKRYASTLKCEEAGKELLKFVMWSLVSEDILYYDDSRDFMYMLATARGLEEKLVNAIRDLSSWLIEHSKLEKWFNTLKQEFSGLGALVYENVRDQLVSKLRHLKVVHIPPEDIVLFLVNNNDICTQFFTPLLSIDTSSMRALEAKSDRIIRLLDRNEVDETKLKSLLQEASGTLMDSVSSTFFNTGNYHVGREETEQIYTWIISSGASSRMALVVGEAGCGKSVVIKDLKLKCDAAGIPSLAIKAEYIKAESVAQIEQKLNIPCPIIDTIRTLAKFHSHIVVFIDQIDALSQYLSANREYIYAFGTLISQLQLIEHVKIIISTRKFDCEHDAEIGKWKEKSQIFSVGVLTPEVVQKVLRKIGCEPGSLSSGLLELLRTPVYLDVFCRLYTPGTLLSDVHTVVGLYDRLWDKYVLQQERHTEIRKLLYDVSDEMYLLQSITVPARKFCEKETQLFGYIRSTHLVEVNNGLIQMFHQSFYDYVYARNFTENSRDVLEFIITQKQNIFIRSSLKMILTFFRDYDCIKYRDAVSEILIATSYKFHIKHLVYAILGSQQNPLGIEMEFVQNVICADREYCMYFLKACTSVKWLDFVLDNPESFRFNQHDPDLDHIHVGLMYRFLEAEQDRIINFIISHRQFSIFSREELTDLLSCLKKWSTSEIGLLEEQTGHLDLTNEVHIAIAEKIAGSDLNYVVRLVESQLETLTGLKASERTMLEYELNELFKTLFEKDAVCMCNMVFRVIDKLVTQKLNRTDILLGHKLLEDELFEQYEYYEGKEQDDNILYSLANLFITHLIAAVDSEFEKYFNIFLQSDKWIWWYASSVVLQKCTPEKSDCRIVRYIEAADKVDAFSGSGPLQHNIWQLIESGFEHLDQVDKKRIVSVLFNILPKWEKSFYREYKRFYLIGMTAYRYLRAIPASYWNTATTEERHKYGELYRRWGKYEYIWNGNRVHMASVVGTPLDNRAYELMSTGQWIKSFYKYDSHFGKDLHTWPPKGDIEQHSAQFEKCVKKLPEKLVSVVVESVENERVDKRYKISGLAGLIGSKYDKNLSADLLIKLIHLDLSRTEHLQLMWAIEHNPDGIRIDEAVFEYIVRHAAENFEETRDDGSISFAINSLQGVACLCLISLYDVPEYKSRIIPIVKSVLSDSPPCARMAILYREAYLMNIDTGMAFEVFLDCIKQVDKQVVYTAQWSLQYFYFRYPDRLADFFNCSVQFLEDHTTRRAYAIFITQLYMEDYAGYDRILAKLLENYSDALDVVFEVALAYYEKPEYRERSLTLLRRYFNSCKEVVCENYELAILRRDDEMELGVYSDFVEEYVNSQVFGMGEHSYFVDYLYKQSGRYPKRVLDILYSVDIKRILGNKKRGYRAAEKWLKVALGALNYVQGNIRYVGIATEIVDCILLNSNEREILVQELDNR